MEQSTLMTTKKRVVLASAHFLCTNCNQEALLLQTDCTTCYIDQDLVNCCTIVGKGFTTNPHEIEVMQLEHCGRRRCSKLYASSHAWHVDRRKCGRQARPSMNLLWQNLSSPSIEFGTELQRKIPFFGDTRISLQHSERKLSYQNQLETFSRFDTKPVCDRHTGT